MMIKTINLLFLLLFIYFPLLAQPEQNYLNISDTLSVDSTKIPQTDSLKVAFKRDTLRPLYYKQYVGLMEIGEQLPKSEINRTDYRYTGDLINHLLFGYLAELGSVGNPSEAYLYGLGFNNISYMSNGVEITNRYQNALDLNLIQSEQIDLIEVPSLSSGFIYNNRSNPVSINLITKNKVSMRPYSRIRFYQAPENEGSFDGQFSAYLFRRVNFSFGISNQNTDSRFVNSELSNWQFNTSVRYMTTNSLNFIGSYSFTKLNMDLNGGVNIFSTPDQLFDNVQADVNFINRYHKATRHDISLSSIFEIDSLSYTNLSFYYQYFLDEFRQNESSFDTTETKFINNNSYKTFGINIHQKFDFNPIKFDIIGNYEKTKFDVAYGNILDQYRWSLGGKMNWSMLSGMISPSLFVKASGLDDRNYFGFGGEIIFNPLEWLSLNLGASRYDKDINRFLNPLSTINGSDVQIIEAGFTTKYSILNLGMKYFSIEQTNFALGQIEDDYNFFNQPEIINYYYTTMKRNGININLAIKLWKFSLQSNSSIYFGEAGLPTYSIPQQSSFGGLYYIDTLFNENLDLKAGLNYKFYGQRGFVLYDFQRMQSGYPSLENKSSTAFFSENFVDFNYQLDLFVAGTIRKRAIVYLVFENMLNTEYYVVPNYPVQPRGFRFGVAWEFLD